MIKISWLLSMIFIVLVASMSIIPAFAEVTSLKDDKPLYILGNKIRFTGTVGIGDYQKLVNLLIHDPAGKFILISGNYSDSTYTFEVTVNTNNTAQFSKKGTYVAIAFTGKESDGKILNFDFSPDGSPVIHSVIQNTNATSNSIPLISQHYQSQISENVGIGDISGNLTKVAPTTVSSEKSSSQYDFKNILYPIISLCGAGIVVAVLVSKKRRKKTEKQNFSETSSSQLTASAVEPEDDYALMILKNRLAKGEIPIDEFKTIRDALAEP